MAPLRQEDYMYDDFINEPVAQSKKQEEPKKQAVPKVKNKVKRKVFLGVLSFSIALTIVYRYAMLNNMSMENIKLKKELAELNNVNAQLQLRAEQSVNLSYVEQYAQENLGLQKPQNYQIEYINVNKQDLVDNKVTSENKNWFKKILFNIIEFFN